MNKRDRSERIQPFFLNLKNVHLVITAVWNCRLTYAHRWTEQISGGERKLSVHLWLFLHNDLDWMQTTESSRLRMSWNLPNSTEKNNKLCLFTSAVCHLECRQSKWLKGDNLVWQMTSHSIALSPTSQSVRTSFRLEFAGVSEKDIEAIPYTNMNKHNVYVQHKLRCK